MKLINCRYPLFAFVLLIMGILTVLCFVYNMVSVGVTIIIVVAIVLSVVVIKKKYVLPAILLVFYLLGIISTSVFVHQTESRYIQREQATIQATVKSITPINGGVRLIAQDVVLVGDRDDKDDSNIPLAGNITIVLFDNYGNDSDSITIGSKIEVSGTISTLYIFQDTINYYAVRNDLSYQLEDAKIITIDSGNMSFVNSIRQYIYSTMSTVEHGGIAYALLIGDKTYVDGTHYETFKDAGIVHLLAVSGLHIGFVVLLFDKLLKLCRVNIKWRFAVVAIPMLLYGYICSFPPSVIRAIVMTMVVYLSRLFYAKSDLLNSLSIAGLVVLTISPMFLFDAGFLLSFGAVFGIATISSAINRKITNRINNKVIRYFVSLISVSIGATAATFFISAQFFGTVSTIGVLTNIVAIPVVTVLFVIAWLSLIPFLPFLLVVVDFVLEQLINISAWMSSWSFAVVDVGNVGVVQIIVVLLLFVLGGFVAFKKQWKAIVSSLLTVLLVAILAVYNAPTNIDNCVMIFDTYSQLLVVITDEESSEINVVCNLSSSYDVDTIAQTVNQYKYTQVNIHIVDSRKNDSGTIAALAQQTKLGAIYVYNAVHLFDTGGHDNIIYVPPNMPVNCGINIDSISRGAFVGLDIHTSYSDFSIATTTNPNLLDYYNDMQYDFVYTLANPDKLAMLLTCDIISYHDCNQDNIYSVNRYGNFTIESKDGTIMYNRGIIAR